MSETVYKSKLIEVDFRVCCKHDRDSHKACAATMDALRLTLNNLVCIDAVKPLEKDQIDWCVIGTALIHPKKKDLFQRLLKKLKIPKQPNNKIIRAKVELPC